jgi:hypothetical protein
MRLSAITKNREDHPVRPDHGRGGVIALQRGVVGISSSSVRAAIAAICLSGLLIAIFGVASARAAQPGDGFAFRGSLENIVPTGVAVDNSTGDVLVATPNNILAYDSGGASAALLSTFGEGASIYGIAVDQSSHAIYTIDSAENVIDRYTRTSTAPLTYALDKTYVSPAQGSGVAQIGSFASAIAVDPSSGDLLVADSANKRVSRFAANGKFISSFDGADSNGGAFTNPQGLTVGPSGSIYVLDFDGEIRFDEAMLGTSRVERFNAAGVAQEEIGVPGEFPEGRRLAFDGNRNDLVVLAGGGEEPAGLIVYVVHEGALLSKFSGAHSDSYGTTFIHQNGVAVDGGATGRLYIATTMDSIYGLNAVSVFDPVEFPTLAAPTAITVHGVHLSGEVFPGSEAITPHFELSTDDVNWSARPELPALSAPGLLSEDVTGLLANQTYYVRLTGVSADTTTSLERSFITAKGAPELVTLAASDVSATRATLPGSVNANGLITSYHFEYGTTTAYGSRAPVSLENGVGQQRTPVIVSVVAEGLEPGATYHYRLVATNSAGTAYGADQILLTDAADSATREFEQVTPVSKSGAEFSRFEGSRIEPDGLALTLGTVGSFTTIPSEGAPANVSYFAERGTEGWNMRSIDLPATHTNIRLVDIFAVSPDFTKAISVSDEALAPGAVAGKTNFYVEDLRTGKLTLAGVAPAWVESAVTFGANVQVSFFGSPDWSRLYVLSTYSFTSESYVGVFPQLYESNHGSLVRIPLTTASGEPLNESYLTIVSNSDGSVLAYADPSTSEKEKGVFLRRGSEVTPVSVSERPGDPKTPQASSKVTWSSDDSAVIFTDEDPSAMPLTSDAPERVYNIYRYVLDAAPGHHLEYVGNGAFFSSKGDTVLYENMGEGGPGLVAWRDGHTHFVTKTSLFPFEEHDAQLLSPDGRYVEVSTATKLTSDPAKTRQIYLYDLETDSLQCASCDGLASAGEAGPGFATSQAAPTDEGEVFFDTTTGLVSEDANAEADVYAYKAGHVHLISRATSGAYSFLDGATPSGDDVFIDTTERLVGQDEDPAEDIYDARVGGGFAAQSPSPRGECTGNACRGVSATTPPPPLAGSETQVSNGNISSPAPKPVARALTRAQKLTGALKACHAKRNKRKRASCEKQARKRFGAKSESKAKKTVKKSTNGKGSK